MVEYIKVPYCITMPIPIPQIDLGVSGGMDISGGISDENSVFGPIPDNLRSPISTSSGLEDIASRDPQPESSSQDALAADVDSQEPIRTKKPESYGSRQSATEVQYAKQSFRGFSGRVMNTLDQDDIPAYDQIRSMLEDVQPWEMDLLEELHDPDTDGF